ncbi:chemotaxis protein CheW [Ramlibacter sp. H39-3-26]|uniref:chemotaxis protein CheW n=1 Tax=Curvibacter soli TaxID=3031331 RepID=UPI0023DB5912|nr:chemotaxis protein CheW [Ramlibacter sp. H39-3-26]MDF1486504.1 chemotaxis protein CheW [Ramlibacter sp. H39-3-26]
MQIREPASLQEPLPIDVFLPFMRDVTLCEQSLKELNLMWRLIESSAKMNCPQEAKTILPTMAATRSGFSKLEKELVKSLVEEKVRTVMAGIGTKAKYVIDIVVRNLYERTADVGFLATDRELCHFVAQPTEDGNIARARLREYRDKYTVYDEIILLDTAGNVLVQIDPATPLEHSSDPLVAETLASDNYVETFRHTDLRPAKERALVYSRRMHHPDTGAVIGVLCLCFGFEQEMQGIFESHGDDDLRSNMLLLSGDGRVIASADPLWIPPGARVPVNLHTESRLMRFCGREYLVSTYASAGYQGYPGPPGWMGQAMIPVDVAFRTALADLLSGLDPAVAQGLLSHAETFCPPLYDIMQAAKTIQRIVWNGQVMTAGQQGDMQKLKTVLEQISETGGRSNELFAQSIHDLYQTVLASSMRDAEFTSHLMVDLLDRNLYERADDCRWWALTPELRQGLAQDTPSPETLARFGEILLYINGLYTVYTRLFVYDRHGRILAITGPDACGDGSAALGRQVEPDTLARVLALGTSQDYCVTPFAPTALYDGRSTYVYHAAIRALSSNTAVGGIGIVFDAEPEFRNMLRAGLAGKANSQALYVTRQGRILSSTDERHPEGGTLTIDPALLALPSGQSASRITIHDGQYAVVACTASSGYREFKTSDGYKEDVVAVVYQFFGEQRYQGALVRGAVPAIDQGDTAPDAQEFATFICNDGLYALAAEHVLEAVPFSDVRLTPLGGGGRIGILGVQRTDMQQRFMWVFDLVQLLGKRATPPTPGSQVMVVRQGAYTLGLLVDELHAVPKFDASQIAHTPLVLQGQSMFTSGMVKANGGELLIQVVDAQRLFDWLIDGKAPAPGEDAVHAALQA